MKYIFENVEFTPKEQIKLTVDGEPVNIQKKQVQLFQFFLENMGRTFSKEEILKALWGEGQHSFSTLSTALTKLNTKLPPLARIEYIKNEGHRLNIKVTKVKPRFERLEQVLQDSTRSKVLYGAVALLLVLMSFQTYETIEQWLNPPATFELGKETSMFTWNYSVQFPQLSPDGRYIAHNLSKKAFEQDYLGLIEVDTRAAKPLVPKGYHGGFKWSLDGKRIVYQNISSEQCEVRLLSFNDDKTDFDDEQLFTCPVKSGRLNFAWFNEHTFYVNLIEGDGSSNTSLLPQHQLYSFDIDTGVTIKVASTDDKTGLGFYALEYDPSIDALYLLRSNSFMSTDVYRYKNSQLDNIGTVDWVVKFYAAANNQLIFKTPDNDLVINYPADDFAGQRSLLRTARDPISQINAAGDSITYLVGESYRRSITKWQDGVLQTVNLANLEPRLIARYQDQLVFSSNTIQNYQLYLASGDGLPQQISDFKVDEPIQHIEITNDIFALSYTNKVDVYRYQQGKLTFITSLSGYTNGVVSDDSKRILVSDLSQQGVKAPVVELMIADQQPTGLQLADAKFAFYYKNAVLYFSHYNELIRLVDERHLVIARNIDVRFLKATSIYQDTYYFIAKKQSPNSIIALDLTDGSSTTITSGHMNLRKIEVIEGQLYLLTWQALQPSIYVSDVMRK